MYVKWKKPEARDHRLYDSSYISHPGKGNLEKQSGLMVVWESFWGDDKCLKLDSVYLLTKNYWIVPLEQSEFYNA